MRSTVIALLGSLVVSLAIPAGALARVRTIAPPGNSGVSQYQEDVPTAKGNRPSNTITAAGTNGPGSSSGAGALSPSTVRALDKQGSAGRGAAALAQATAPGRVPAAHPGSASASPTTSASGQASGSSPVSSVVKALTGSSHGGGLGALLPIILIAALVAGGGLALLRRRRAT